MRAVGLLRYGGPEVLRVVEIPTPHAGTGEVRIRVRAAAVNPADTLIRAGLTPVRIRGTEPLLCGLDVAGTIDEVGPDTSGALAPGDAVMAMVNPTRPAGGGYAEWVVLPESWVVPVPSGASFAEAATLPMNGLTALRALDLLDLPVAGTVAVTGAAGAVGGYAVQLARVAGHRVLADAAPGDVGLVAELGADVTVARGPDVADRFRAHAPGGVDAAVDAALIGDVLLPAVRDGGAVALLRDPGEVRSDTRGIRRVTPFVHDYDGRPDKLGRLRQLAEAGELALRVAGRFRPSEAARAHQLLEAGGVRGRLIIEF